MAKVTMSKSPSRPIKTFTAPAPGPHHNPPKPLTGPTATSRQAVRIAHAPPGINGKQQHN
ncbi:hypothetical protein [Bradyrhizobium sp. RT10b]|uniref:hypothetical protein n=1 Tax=Bradyrhizobium sp. RT10b TaxID=3156331 RepID=UPI0033927285